MTNAGECYSCVQDAVFDDLRVWERIAADEHWRVAHAFGTSLPGWLVLMPRRHVTSIADLTDAEAAGLGLWQVRISRALHEVTGCEKAYMAQFAEGEGFSHVHFHMMPRMSDLAAEFRGPRVFGLMGGGGDDAVPAERMDELARALAQVLTRT